MRYWIGFTVAALSLTVMADEDPFGDAFNNGFSDVETSTQPSGSNLYLANWLQHRGQFTTAHAAPEPMATDHRGLASLMTGWNTRLEWRPREQISVILDAELNHDWVFGLRSDTDWQAPYRDQRETQLKLDEARIGYTTSKWALSSGRQVQTWGFNDVLSILEPVNPPRLSQPGLHSSEEARLSRWLSEARWYIGSWTLQGVVAHENRVAELPVYGSDYYPLPSATDNQTPDQGWENVGAHSGGIRLSGLWRNADLAAFIWRGYNPTGHLVFAPDAVDRRYERVTIAGAGVSVPIGLAVIKAEFSAEDGLAWAPVSGTAPQPPQTQGDIRTTQRVSWALGGDLNLPGNNRLVLEYHARYLPDYQPAMAVNLGDEYSHRWALGAEHRMARDRLTLSTAILGFGLNADSGQVLRIGADWNISDQWRTEIGWVGYRSGAAAALQSTEGNDRLFWQTDWLF